MTSKRTTISVWGDKKNLEEAKSISLDVHKIIEEAIDRAIEIARAARDGG